MGWNYYDHGEELLIASRRIAFALTDTLANEAHFSRLLYIIITRIVIVMIITNNKDLLRVFVASDRMLFRVQNQSTCLKRRRSERLICPKWYDHNESVGSIFQAEQQSALLPVATVVTSSFRKHRRWFRPNFAEAATIALSGAVTFGVELNPFVASALAVVQAVVKRNDEIWWNSFPFFLPGCHVDYCFEKSPSSKIWEQCSHSGLAHLTCRHCV